MPLGGHAFDRSNLFSLFFVESLPMIFLEHTKVLNYFEFGQRFQRSLISGLATSLGVFLKDPASFCYVCRRSPCRHFRQNIFISDHYFKRGCLEFLA